MQGVQLTSNITWLDSNRLKSCFTHLKSCIPKPEIFCAFGSLTLLSCEGQTCPTTGGQALTLKQPSIQTLDVQPSSYTEPINLLGVYRSLLRIVARLEDQEYTAGEVHSRQTEVMEHPDPAAPASDRGTSQG